MSDVHDGLAVAMVVVNAVAGAWGAWCWWRFTPSRAFWPLLRTGQALMFTTAVVLVARGVLGQPLDALDWIYGLTPLGVSFLAEQLRVAAAQTVLDQRGLEGSQAVGRLPREEQRGLVLDIVRRELGVMAVSALVVATLGLRALGLL